VVAFFAFMLVAMGAAAASVAGGPGRLACALIAVAVTAAAIDAVRTVRYAMHPQYTYANAAKALTDYVDEHPNGRRLLLSISGDQITMMAHLPSMCDDFGTLNLPQRLDLYQPGWFATWNDLDPGTLQDLHTRYSLEQVATFRALDDPERNRLVLFKLHRLPDGQVRKYSEALKRPMAGDLIQVLIE
jgi:hypothetical protein